MSERARWEERYRERIARPLPPPSRFLVEHLPALPHGRVLDVACGQGRHAIYLARRGFPVEGIDFSFTALRRAAALARAEGLPAAFVQADLRTYPLPADRYAVVLDIRYLERTLWPRLKAAVRIGGVVLVETFTEAQRALGHPTNPAFLLRHGELRKAFRDFELLEYAEGLFETETGPAHLARMLARRPRARTAD